MKIYYATTRHTKVLSLRREIGDITKIVQVPIDFPEPRSSNVKEISKSKIIYAYNQIKRPVVVLDAGFYIDSLNGFPRTFVNFALETIGIEGILKLVEGKDKSCEFRQCLAYLDSYLSKPKYFVSSVPGTLSNKPRGEMQDHLWSELSTIFVPEGIQKTLAEMSYKEYVDWHKKPSIRPSSKLFSEWLLKYLSKQKTKNL